MRIIAGNLKKRTLKEVPHRGTRSTKDRVKENLFNMLPPLGDLRILDLFAGSGALGFEALSRGAREATFTEIDKAAFGVLSENTRALALSEMSKLHKGDALCLLKRFEKPFDVIFLDPPYKKNLISESLSIIEKRTLLSEGGIITLLHAKDESPDIPKSFQILKTRTYGITSLTFLEWSD